MDKITFVQNFVIQNAGYSIGGFRKYNTVDVVKMPVEVAVKQAEQMWDELTKMGYGKQ